MLQIALLLNAFTEPVFIFSHDLFEANHEFWSFLGYKHTSTLKNENLNDHLAQAIDLISLAGKKGVATELIHANGSKLVTELEIISIGQDLVLVKLRAAQQARSLMHHQRLETLGILAGSISHDFNNILTGVLGHVSYLRLSLPERGKHLESLLAIEDGARRAALMTQQILSFTKADNAGEFTNVDLVKTVKATCALIKGSFSKNHSIEIILPETEIIVSAIESQISQILINLVVNARDALADSGKIEVSIKEFNFSQHKLQTPFGTKTLDGEYTCICVRDDGAGIDDQLKDIIFEPYFSTKKDKGTGLGLATVASIVKLHNGELELISELNCGTQVLVYLPKLNLRSEQQVCAGPQVGKTKVNGGKERILVVDDEPPVRSVISMCLERLGYQVELAASGAEALEKYENPTSHFDLVILDMIMPQLSGPEVFHRLAKIDPNLRVLISTAYTSQEAIESVLNAGGKDFIRKPFTVEELAQKVRKCLDL